MTLKQLGLLLYLLDACDRLSTGVASTTIAQKLLLMCLLELNCSDRLNLNIGTIAVMQFLLLSLLDP